MKEKVQVFGRTLSGMVMPNIGAFIAWGLLTALFIASGWFPNETLAQLNTPMSRYLLPLLIGYTGGKAVSDQRGGVIGAIATMGVIVGSDIPMFIGAMIMGPLAAWILKKFDKLIEGKVKAGFEMLVNNFSLGIIGAILAAAAVVIIAPVVTGLNTLLEAGVNVFVEHQLLSLASLFIEPAKVLFLNNAINHGILSPMGIQQVEEAGKSIFFLLEANPGPGLGVLLAYCIAGKGSAKSSAPGAVIIHFFGGIHEIYFPYILMNPLVIVAPILGNMAAIFWFNLTGCGLRGPASPGSIIAYLMMTPGSDMWKVIVGVILSAAISFVISVPIVKMAGGKSLEDAQKEMAAKKAEAKGQPVPAQEVKTEGIKKIIFACDAGMGSSAMGATKFRKRLEAVRPDIKVTNTSVDNIPSDCDIAIVQVTLVERAKKSAPQAGIITIGNFLSDPNLDELYEKLVNEKKEKAAAKETEETEKAEVTEVVDGEESRKPQVIVAEGIRLNQTPVSKEEAIQAAGELLAQLGYVDISYADAMQEREKIVTTYMGMGVAIPHGTTQAKGTVKKTGIVLLQYPDGVEFGDEKAQLVFGIAGIGDEHLDLLAKICEMLEDEDLLETLKTTADVDWVLEKLT